MQVLSSRYSSIHLGYRKLTYRHPGPYKARVQQHDNRNKMMEANNMFHIQLSSYVLTTFPYVIRNVLQSLPAQDLNRCARVCKAWRDEAKKVKGKRRSAFWSVELFEDGRTTEAVERVNSDIKNLYSEPIFFLLFCQTDLVDSSTQRSSPRMSTRNHTFDRLIPDILSSKILPNDCLCVGLATDGVIGTAADLSSTYEVESEISLSYLSLPKYDGVDIYQFMMEGADDGESISSYSTVPSGKHVKTLFFFACEPVNCSGIGQTMLSMYPGAVIAGGYVDKTITRDTYKEESDTAGESPAVPLMCLAFCGERLKTASVLLNAHISTEKEVEVKMKQLKNCNLPEDVSFAFIFACVGRGQYHYNQECVETRIFKKYFPKTPILGFFGNGEIGFNYLPVYNKVDGTLQSEPKTKPKQMGYSYTSVICLISVT